MGKVLRLHTGANNNIEGWQNSQQYGSQVYADPKKGIKDPNVNATNKPITSIPSPFAQWDLLKTAFNFVAFKDENGTYPHINKSTIYNKIVSHALDVGQLFFEYDKHTDDFEILVWDRQTSIQDLQKSQNQQHQQLGHTLELFLTQDRINVDKIYMLNYKHGKNPITIVGATSPTTIFMASPSENNLQNLNINFGNDSAFDDNYLPFYQRDLEFHKYLWALSKNHNTFANDFPEFFRYLDACYSLSGTQRRTELQNAVNQFQQYEDLLVDGNIGMPVTVGNITLKKRISPIEQIKQSDFIIKSSKSLQNQNLPLVLPVDAFNLSWKYTVDIWNSQTKVPFSDDRSLEQRTLPQVGDKYPYLTIGDFLEDTIIELPEKQNNENYWNALTNQNVFATYLLPLKPLFFEYFTVDELTANRMCSIETSGNYVKVNLTIPIKKGMIQYTRSYYRDCEPSGNDGRIETINGFIFASASNVRYLNPALADYRFILVCEPQNFSTYNANVNAFNENGQIIQPKKVVQRNTDTNDEVYQKTKTFVVQGSNVDYLQMEIKGITGMVIPKLIKEGGNNQFKFAVDFGTTNTHIEYCTNINQNPIPLDITSDDVQLHVLTNVDSPVFDSDFIPHTIGTNNHHIHKFPIRTVLSYAGNVNWQQTVYSLADANMTFIYEKDNIRPYNTIETELKWSNETNNSEKVRAYIENILILLRNKVILNNGRLDNTELIWFYPVSMTQAKRNRFSQIWIDSYRKIFGTDKISSMTESVAPYYFVKGSLGQANSIVIDIGGGTTDILFADNMSNITDITSFRFAANNLFGTGFSHQGTVGINPMVDYYYQEFMRIIEHSDEKDRTEISQLVDAAKLIKGRGISTDIASYLFSLNGNANIREFFNESLDFVKQLSDPNNKYRVAFLVFYSAIIYHIARFMKAKNYSTPRYIAFSGNGSRVINVISSNAGTLSELAKIIFELTYNQKYDRNGLSVIQQQDPKGITCKGGLISANNAQPNVNNLKSVFLFDDEFVQNQTYESIDSYVDNTEQEVMKFIDILIQANNNLNFSDYFDIDSTIFQEAMEIIGRDCSNHIRTGIGKKQEEVAPTDRIEETLFFYAITGMINALINNL